jgi:hypothetical protein
VQSLGNIAKLLCHSHPRYAPLDYLHGVLRRIVSGKAIINVFPLKFFYKLVYCTYIYIYNLYYQKGAHFLPRKLTLQYSWQNWT